jgi:hypothetical protein
MTSTAKAPVSMEPLAARLKGVPFPQPRKARARRPPTPASQKRLLGTPPSRQPAGRRRYSLFPQAVKTCPSQTIYEMGRWVPDTKRAIEWSTFKFYLAHPPSSFSPAPLTFAVTLYCGNTKNANI